MQRQSPLPVRQVERTERPGGSGFVQLFPPMVRRTSGGHCGWRHGALPQIIPTMETCGPGPEATDRESPRCLGMSIRGTAVSRVSTSGAQGEADIVAQFRARHLELVRLAALLLGDSAAAEDVVQDVFTRVWEGRRRLAAAGFTAPYTSSIGTTGTMTIVSVD